jgi:hypothetical protein
MEAITVSFPFRLKVPAVIMAFMDCPPVVAALLGAFAFQSYALVPLSLLVLTLWAKARTRYTALLVGVFYFIGFTHAVPQGVFGYKDIAKYLGKSFSVLGSAEDGPKGCVVCRVRPKNFCLGT